MKNPPIDNTTSPPWASWFMDVKRGVSSVGSGPTASRPTTGLQINNDYFDTTLGYRIVYNGAAWVRWDGTPV